MLRAEAKARQRKEDGGREGVSFGSSSTKLGSMRTSKSEGERGTYVSQQNGVFSFVYHLR